MKIGDLIRDKFDDDIYLVLDKSKINGRWYWKLLNPDGGVEDLYDLSMNLRNYEVINEAR